MLFEFGRRLIAFGGPARPTNADVATIGDHSSSIDGTFLPLAAENEQFVAISALRIVCTSFFALNRFVSAGNTIT